MRIVILCVSDFVLYEYTFHLIAVRILSTYLNTGRTIQNQFIQPYSWDQKLSWTLVPNNLIIGVRPESSKFIKEKVATMNFPIKETYIQRVKFQNCLGTLFWIKSRLGCKIICQSIRSEQKMAIGPRSTSSRWKAS